MYVVSGYKVTFELTARDVLLIYFFTTIGINARVSDLEPCRTLLGDESADYAAALKANHEKGPPSGPAAAGNIRHLSSARP